MPKLPPVDGSSQAGKPPVQAVVCGRVQQPRSGVPSHANQPPGEHMIAQEFKRIDAAMDEVAHRFAHRLALDLECVLAKYDGPWYDQAWETLSQYRSEMNKLHEQVSPTFMGEPLIKDTP
jgi:hypothetical protein